MKKCVLVKENRPCAKVVLEKETHDLAREALIELVTGVAKSTGVRLPIDGRKVFSVILENLVDAKTIISFRKLETNHLGKDGFKIIIAKNSLVFVAETKFGFRNSVYYFLEKYCGFIWLWPGNDGEVFDELADIILPVGEEEIRPAFLWRHINDCHEELVNPLYSAQAYAKATFHMHQSEWSYGLMKQWYRQNRMGGLKIYYGHTWSFLVSPAEYGDSHPEYFAETNGSRNESIRNWTGKHGGQLCTSNKDVVELCAKKIGQFFDLHPEYDVFSISPNDGEGFCECDDCIIIDNDLGGNVTGNISAGLDVAFRDGADTTGRSCKITGPITDRIFLFGNQVAEILSQTHPDKMLLLLVYSMYREPPKKVKLHPNVIAQFCVQCHQHWDDVSKENDYQSIKDLAASAEAIGIYEYYEQGAWPGVIRSFPDLIKQSVLKFHEIGARYYQVQASAGFATNGFNLWLLSKLLWNPEIKVDWALDKYCQKAFGNAAEIMKKYFDLWRDVWKKHKGLSLMGDFIPGAKAVKEPLVPFDQIRRLYGVGVLERAEALIEQARGYVTDNSAERRRIDFVAKGLSATELAVEAANSYFTFVELYDWPKRDTDITDERLAKMGNPAAVREKAIELLTVWEKWEGFLEQHRDNFVIGHFWARYCYDSRKWLHPYFTIRKILEALP